MNKKDKIKSGLIVSGLLDLIGANIFITITQDLKNIIVNSKDNGEILMEYISHFISNGGITNYSFDDRIYNSSVFVVMSSLLSNLYKFKEKTKEKKFFIIKKIIKESFLNYMKDNIQELKISYSSDVNNTEHMINNINFDDNYIGLENKNISSDICIIVIPIGILYYNDTDNLIEYVVQITKLTHYNTTSILAALTTCFFVSQCLLETPIEKWIQNILEILNSKKVKKYIDFDKNENMMEYSNFIKNFIEYSELRFSEGKIKKFKSDDNLLYKLKFYNKYVQNKNSWIPLGDDCISCLIIAYDSLLTAEDNLEKNIYNSLLIPGNNIVIGGLLGILYGLMYGTNKINNYLLKIISQYLTENTLMTILSSTQKF